MKVYFQNIKSFIVNKKYAYIILKDKDILVLDMKNKVTEEVNMLKRTLKNKVEGNYLYKTIWGYIAIILIAVTTLFYGAKIYESGVKYNGKLSCDLQDFFHKKIIKLQHNNIYESGVDGVFQDIKKKISMPEKLYVATSFSFNFDSNGIITFFDTFLYGKSSMGQLKSYLISYDSKKSDEIIVNLDGYVNEDYNEEKLLDPFIETMKVLPIKDSIEYWNEEHFGILYYGKKSFGYNTDGNVKAATKAPTELIGYFASLYVPGKEKTYMPYRYALEEDLANIKQEEQLKKNKEEEEAAKKASSDTEQFYLSDKVGFVCLSHSGGITVELYGTQDGGRPSKR